MTSSGKTHTHTSTVRDPLGLEQRRKPATQTCSHTHTHTRTSEASSAALCKAHRRTKRRCRSALCKLIEKVKRSTWVSEKRPQAGGRGEAGGEGGSLLNAATRMLSPLNNNKKTSPIRTLISMHRDEFQLCCMTFNCISGSHDVWTTRSDYSSLFTAHNYRRDPGLTFSRMESVIITAHTSI